MGGSELHVLVHHLDSVSEHLFMCLLAICIFFFRKKMFSDLLSTLNWVICLLLLSFKKYSLDASSLSDILFANIFFHSVGCIYAFLMVFSEAQKF